MSAGIKSQIIRNGLVWGPEIHQQSREDLKVGDIIDLTAIDNGHSDYVWDLVFTPDAPGNHGPLQPNPLDGKASAAALSHPDPANKKNVQLTVDNEGSYLVRLTVDAGLPSESTQFLRFRYLTVFGDLRLVAAGERRDQVAVIPADATFEGWTDDQNQNLQRLLAFVRRVSTSGRVLYVDANRGRKTWSDGAGNIIDSGLGPDNLIELPGPNASDPSGSGTVVGSEGFGDFYSINQAIAYAMDAAGRGEPAPSSENPYVILVQPGLYKEDVALKPWIHVIANTTQPAFSAGMEHPTVTIRTSDTQTLGYGHHFTTGAAGSPGDTVLLHNVVLENKENMENPVLTVEYGQVILHSCLVHQQEASGASTGPAIQIKDHNNKPRLQLIDSKVKVEADHPAVNAIVVDTTSYTVPDAIPSLRIESSNVVSHGSCLYINHGPLPYEDLIVVVKNSNLISEHADGVGIQGYPSNLHMSGVRISSNHPLHLNPNGVGKNGPFAVKMDGCHMGPGNIEVDTTNLNAVGGIDFSVNSSVYSEIEIVAGDPADFHLTTLPFQSEGVLYDQDKKDYVTGVSYVPAPQQFNTPRTTSVQGAIDDLLLLSTPVGGAGEFSSLDTAYDGFISLNPPTPGNGAGRKIFADSGAVQIVSGDAPVGPGPSYDTPNDTDGRLQVEAGVLVGGLDTPELFLDPNPFTAGPTLRLGNSIWPSLQASNAAGGSLMAAGSVFSHATPDGHNYNLNLIAQSSTLFSSGSVGDVNIIAGTALGDNPVPGHSAGNVIIRAGDYQSSTDSFTNDSNLGTGAGSILLQPGIAPNSSDLNGAVVIFQGPSTTSPSYLQAANPFGGDPTGTLSVNYPGIKGTLLFATPMGVVETAMIDDTMSLAGVQAAIDAAGNTPLVGLITSSGMGTHDTGLPTETIRVGMTAQGYGAQVLFIGDKLHQDALDAGYVSGDLNAAVGDFRISDGAIEVQHTTDGRRTSASVGLKTAEDGVLEVTKEPFGTGLGSLVASGLVAGGLTLGIARTNVAGLFDVPDDVVYVGVDSTAGAIVVRLPNEDLPGKLIIVKDEEGLGSNPGNEITIVVTNDGVNFGLIDKVDTGVTPVPFGAGKLSYTLLCLGEIGGQVSWSLV